MVRAIQGLRVEGRRGRVRPKLAWEQMIQADLRACVVDGSLSQNRRAWKAEIRQPDPASDGTWATVDGGSLFFERSGSSHF